MQWLQNQYSKGHHRYLDADRVSAACWHGHLHPATPVIDQVCFFPWFQCECCLCLSWVCLAGWCRAKWGRYWTWNTRGSHQDDARAWKSCVHPGVGSTVPEALQGLLPVRSTAVEWLCAVTSFPLILIWKATMRVERPSWTHQSVAHLAVQEFTTPNKCCARM